MYKLLIIISLGFLLGCGEKEKVTKTEKVKQEFSCEKSKQEIDAVLKKQESGEKISEEEYWQLRQLEYNEKCEKIYNVS